MPEYTIKEYAARERVTERTVRNWIAKGAVHVRRTNDRGRVPGRGVRIVIFTTKDEEENGSQEK